MKSLTEFFLNEYADFDQVEISKLKDIGYEFNPRWRQRFSKNGENLDKISNTYFHFSIDGDDFEKKFRSIKDFISWNNSRRSQE